MSKKTQFILATLLILWIVAARLLPHQANVTPLVAIALAAGAYLKKWYTVFVPLAALLISDYFLGGYEIGVMISVYASFALIWLTGTVVRKYKQPATVLIGALFSSTLFFILTNFAVWVFTPWYAKSVAGLLQNYSLALPFYRQMLFGDLIYVAIVFGVFEGVILFHKKYKNKQTVVTG